MILMGAEPSRVRIDFRWLKPYGLRLGCIRSMARGVKDQIIQLITDPAKAVTMKNIHAMGWEPGIP